MHNACIEQYGACLEIKLHHQSNDQCCSIILYSLF